MNLSLGRESLCRYVSAQLLHFFPDGGAVDGLGRCLEETLFRLEACFCEIDDPRFGEGREVRFSHLHSDQYAMFLYLLSNTLHRNHADPALSAKLYCLNKALHSIDVFFEVELPRVFLFMHPVGTVLGRANYSDYFLVHQNCTVGISRWKGKTSAGDYPSLGRYLAIYQGASVLGPCHIGDNCKIAAHSVLMDRDLERDTIFIGDKRSCAMRVNQRPDRCWRRPSTD